MIEPVTVKGTMLKCDGCGEYYDGLGDGGAISIDDDSGSIIEEAAQDDGWVKQDDKHYCPSCRPTESKVIFFGLSST